MTNRTQAPSGEQAGLVLVVFVNLIHKFFRLHLPFDTSEVTQYLSLQDHHFSYIHG